MKKLLIIISIYIIIILAVIFGFKMIAKASSYIPVTYRTIEVETYVSFNRFVDPDNGNVCYYDNSASYGIQTISCVKP